VLTEPLNQTADLCAVWLNGGPQRHSGPNRMWVEAARRWAAQGVPSLRIDLAGIGDAEGDSRPLVDARSFFVPEYLQQVRLALDFLQARGTASRFVLIGLCAGGYWALQVALEDERVCAALMLNPGLLLYDGGWSKALADTQTVARKALRTSTWRRVLSGQSTLSAHLRTARILLAGTRRARLGLVSRRARRDRGDKSDHDEIDRAFDTLRERGQRALMVFAGEERLYGRLRREGRLDRMGRWPNIAVEHIAPTGDLHTLRPLWLQCRVHQMLDEALDRELASSFSGHPLGIASGRGAR
jgi:pimeloyl-ACP methyl ester carboxylesterase